MNAAVIVAAGRSARMGVDKLFLPLAGRPLIAHTWQRLDSSPDIAEIVVVVRDETRADFESVASSLRLEKPWRLVAGGAERQDSVTNGVNSLESDVAIVAIHDGARPCTSHDAIAQVIAAAQRVGAAVAAQKVTDTLKHSTDGASIAHNVDRTHLWSVQTPQAFRVDVIRRALAEVRARGLNITDDTAACELIGQKVQLVETFSPNPKATTKADLAFIEMLLLQGSKPRPD